MTPNQIQMTVNSTTRKILQNLVAMMWPIGTVTPMKRSLRLTNDAIDSTLRLSILQATVPIAALTCPDRPFDHVPHPICRQIDVVTRDDVVMRDDLLIEARMVLNQPGQHNRSKQHRLSFCQQTAVRLAI